MDLLKPDSNHKKPSSTEARAMCLHIPLELRKLVDARLDVVLSSIRETHENGGILFASFDVGPSAIFDWFASRNRLLEFGILRQLLDRVEVTSSLPELKIPPSRPDDPAFSVSKLKDLISAEQMAKMMQLDIVRGDFERHGINDNFEIAGSENDDNFRDTSCFIFDGDLANAMYGGGAYTRPTGDGRVQKENALAFVDALFESRFSEVWYCSTNNPWTPWFGNIAWDWTAILFDLRARTLSILAVTDSD